MRAAFCRCALRVFSSSEMLGSAIGMNIRSPSFSGGMNSLPMRLPATSAPANSRPAHASVAPRCESAHSSTGRYSARRPRITGFASSACIRPPSSSVQSTGTSVTAMTVAASTANVLVNASGWNSLPSWPVSAKTGTNASRMIAIEKNTGRPDEPRRFEDGAPHRRAIAGVDVLLLEEAERVLGDDDAGVDEHADGDRDAREAHDVRREAGVVHAEERRQHGERQRQRDDQDRAEVHQEDDVRERHEDDFFDERGPQRADGAVDQLRAVVEGHDA